ncbi:heparinase [Candidatus Poribacteria bacterium]|nr:heparinase [Candidatus Poribacteria bacterium]
MRLNYYLEKLRKYPPYVIAYKISSKFINRLRIIITSLFSHLSSDHISDKELTESLNISFNNLDNLSKYFRKKESFCFFPSIISKDDTVSLIKKLYPESIESTINDADRICDHVFDILGSGPVNLGDKIDWHTDFKVGWTWKKKYFKLYKHTNYSKPYDIKIPWELSRCQHFVTLGKAYWYTNDEKYAKEFVCQILDWIKSNPPKIGINWAGIMDVAIRLVNWIWGYHFFKGSPHIDDNFIIIFLKSLLAHGEHIINNLEDEYEFNTNHYLSDLVGLIYLSISFPEFKKCKEWGNFAVNELIREMEKQVYPDGVDYEGSISYHRLVTELFLSATLLVLQSNKYKFPEWYMHRLENMIYFVLYYTKTDGNAPQIGDSDDGRLHILSNYSKWNRLNHSYLLSAGAAIFSRSDFKAKAAEFHEESIWLLSLAGFNHYEDIEIKENKIESRGFTRGGIYLMRNSDMYMVVDCSSVDNKSPSGHKHNSRLSFEIFAYGKNLLVDPGSYLYTADAKWRNTFRSTSYHNTIELDGYEQSALDDINLFLLNSVSEVKVIKWETKAEYDFLDVQHNGYTRLSDPVIHNRKIFFHKKRDYWLIQDLLVNPDMRENSFEKEHKGRFYLHFAPMNIDNDPNNPLFLIATSSDNTGIIIHSLGNDEMDFSVEQGWLSLRYGEKIPSPIICYEKSGKLPLSFEFIFYPFSGNLPEIDVEEIKEDLDRFIRV